jgi:HK97 gp10 family phage protein
VIQVTIDEPQLKQAMQTLSDLPRKRIKPGVRQAVRAAAKPILAQAKANAPRKTGVLRRGLQVRPLREKRGMIAVTVTAANVKRKNGSNANKYAHLVEGGTKSHVIRPKNKKLLRWVGGATSIKGKANKVARFARVVHHPGARANRFLARAATSAQSSAVSAFVAKVRQVVEKYGA